MWVKYSCSHGDVQKCQGTGGLVSGGTRMTEWHLPCVYCMLRAYPSPDAAAKVTSSSHAHMPMLLVPELGLAQSLRCIHIRHYHIQSLSTTCTAHPLHFLVHGTTTICVVIYSPCFHWQQIALPYNVTHCFLLMSQLSRASQVCVTPYDPRGNVR